MSDEQLQKHIFNTYFVEGDRLISSMLEHLQTLQKTSNPDAEVCNLLMRDVVGLRGASLALGKLDFSSFLSRIFKVTELIREEKATQPKAALAIIKAACQQVESFHNQLKVDTKCTFSAEALEDQLGHIIHDSLAANGDQVVIGGDIEIKEDSDDKASNEEAFLATFKDKRILLCEDVEDMADLMKAHLEDVGLENIDWAEDGLSAWRMLGEKGYDLILTDQKMPGLTGLELIQRLHDIGSRIPVVMVSGFAERDDMVTMLNLGVYDFVEKPIDFDRLNVIMRNALLNGLIRQLSEDLGVAAYKVYLRVMRIVDPNAPQSEIDALEKQVSEITELTQILIRESQSTNSHEDAA